MKVTQRVKHIEDKFKHFTVMTALHGVHFISHAPIVKKF